MPKKTIILIIGLVLTTIALFVIALTTGSKVCAATTYPTNAHYVNDYANVISDGAERSLNQKLEAYKKQTTNQVSILTVDTTGAEDIAEYGIHVADQWKIGLKGKDNGVILIVAVKDRKTRIEVGRGLEGELTDLETKHIQNDFLSPALKQNKYDEGITKTTDALISSITVITVTPAPANHSQQTTMIVIAITIVVVIFATLGVLALIFGEDSLPYFLFQMGLQLLMIIISMGGGRSSDSSDGGGGSFSGGGSSDDF